MKMKIDGKPFRLLKQVLRQKRVCPLCTHTAEKEGLSQGHRFH